jgi:antitoxin HicB
VDSFAIERIALRSCLSRRAHTIDEIQPPCYADREDLKAWSMKSLQIRGGKLRNYEYTVLFEPQDGGFNVIVPAIPEICTFGESIAEARQAAQDAIRCYLESAIKNGEPIPVDAKPSQEQIAVTV